MNIVLLDSGTLPVPLTAPAWAGEWSGRLATRAADVVHALEDAAIAITNKVPIRAADLKRLPKLRFICIAATGFDCIDIDACRESGVIVSNVPGYSAQSVSEWALASIFALRRNLFAYRETARTGWRPRRISAYTTRRFSTSPVRRSALSGAARSAVRLPGWPARSA